MQTTHTTQAASSVEQHIDSIRKLLEKSRFAAALAAADAVLATVPLNRDALYMAAVAQRYLQQPEAALGLLDQLEAAAPLYGRLFQERGHCLLVVQQPDRALAAYQRAVTLNPALQASWKALVALYQTLQRPDDADRAHAQCIHLEKLPAALVSVTSLMHEDDLFKAEQICRHFLRTHGHHLEGMRLLASIGTRLDVLDDAEFLLESVLEFAPDYHSARYDYAQVLGRRQKFAKAREQAARLLAIEPENRVFQALHAAQCAGLGDHASAIEQYRQLLIHTPQDPLLHLSIGHALRSLGQVSEAIDAYRDAAHVKPDFGDAYWSLANLKTYRFPETEMAAMRALEATSETDSVDRYHCCFALGKALEDREDYAESFRYYARGNAAKKAEVQYRADYLERDLKLQQSVCTAEFLAARRGVGCQHADPIFIVGLPRAGSTLLEQILASHSQVEGTMELPNIRGFAMQLDGRRRNDEPPRYPSTLAGLRPDALTRMGERYLADTRMFRGSAPCFIDKMPNNFRHIGLIHLILPNARIIDARRDAMGCCFSGYKQLFAAGQEFTYGLDDIGHYYRQYVELMSHWDSVLPGKVLRVQYEEVVDHLEDNVRRLLDFCGLPFETACLEFHKTSRSIRTPSSEQVRRPIFREGVDQWRHFEPWLGPLKAALDPLAGT